MHVRPKKKLNVEAQNTSSSAFPASCCCTGELSEGEPREVEIAWFPGSHRGSEARDGFGTGRGIGESEAVLGYAAIVCSLNLPVPSIQVAFVRHGKISDFFFFC
jgi:hypothetical protein